MVKDGTTPHGCCPGGISVAAEGRERCVFVMFRYDDYSARSYFEVDRGVIELFASHQLPLLVAAIPAVKADGVESGEPIRGERADFLEKAVASTPGLICVAVHGLHHRSNHMGGDWSEFRGLTAEDASAKIELAIQTLTELDVVRDPTTFVPPWNSYDKKTLEALERQNVRVLSASCGPTMKSGLSFVPATCDLLEGEVAIRYAQQRRSGHVLVNILMHDWEFAESGDVRARQSLKDLERVVKWVKACPGVRVISLNDIAHTLRSQFDHRRMWWNCHLKWTFRRLNRLFFSPASTLVYWSLGECRIAVTILATIGAAFIGCNFGCAFIAGMTAARWVAARTALRMVGGAGVALLLGEAGRKRIAGARMGWKAAAAGIGWLAFCLGLVWETIVR